MQSLMILFRLGCLLAADVAGRASSARSARTSGAMLRIRLTACVRVGFAGCEAGPAPRWRPPRSAAACGTARPTAARLSRVLRAGRSSRLQRPRLEESCGSDRGEHQHVGRGVEARNPLAWDLTQARYASPRRL